jgi:hypothetical protein
MRASSRRWSAHWPSAIVVLVAAAALVPLSATSAPTAAAAQAPANPYVNTTAFYGHGDLAFVSLGDLYVLDGASRHVVNVTGADLAASGPRFSPNGKWLTYETDAYAVVPMARAVVGHEVRHPDLP